MVPTGCVLLGNNNLNDILYTLYFIIFTVITSGHYAVTNVISFGLHSGMKTTLATPLIQDTHICFEFWYNLPTSTSNLQVNLYQSKNFTTIWTAKGPKGNIWNKLQLSIQNDHPFKVSLVDQCQFSLFVI